MSQSTSYNKHFLFATIPAFGHAHPEVSTACKLIQADPSVVITILAVKFFLPVIEQEVSRAKLSLEAQSRVKVIAVGQADPPPKGGDLGGTFAKLVLQLGEDASNAYRTIVNRGILTCTATDKRHDFRNTLPPSIAFLDCFMAMLPWTIKSLTPNVALVHVWISGACSFISHYGPAEHGGTLAIEERTRTAYDKGDMEFVQKEAMKVLGPGTGKPYPNPEGLKLYDYENVPQDSFTSRVPLPPQLIIPTFRFVTQLADATMLMTIRDFQPKDTQVIKEWFEDGLGRKAFYIGTQATPSPPTPYKSPAADPSHPFAPVFNFLDSHPPKSVVLISFGTLFYSSTHPWRLETIIKTLLMTRTPFILSRAAMMSTEFEPKLETRLQDQKDIAFVTPFVPQRDVLDHPSLAAFLTHGGINSMHESIMAGVTNIFWPISADQPLHAAYMTEKLDCSFELIQVRTGPGAQPPMRGGKVEGTSEAVEAEFRHILTDLKNDVGARKKKNLMAVRQKFLDAMKPGGESQTELKGVLALHRQNGLEKNSAQNALYTPVVDPVPSLFSYWSRALVFAILSVGIGMAVTSMATA